MSPSPVSDMSKILKKKKNYYLQIKGEKNEEAFLPNMSNAD